MLFWQTCMKPHPLCLNSRLTQPRLYSSSSCSTASVFCLANFAASILRIILIFTLRPGLGSNCFPICVSRSCPRAPCSTPPQASSDASWSRSSFPLRQPFSACTGIYCGRLLTRNNQSVFKKLSNSIPSSWMV